MHFPAARSGREEELVLEGNLEKYDAKKKRHYGKYSEFNKQKAHNLMVEAFVCVDPQRVSEAVGGPVGQQCSRSAGWSPARRSPAPSIGGSVKNRRVGRRRCVCVCVCVVEVVATLPRGNNVELWNGVVAQDLARVRLPREHQQALAKHRHKLSQKIRSNRDGTGLLAIVEERVVLAQDYQQFLGAGRGYAYACLHLSLALKDIYALAASIPKLLGNRGSQPHSVAEALPPCSATMGKNANRAVRVAVRAHLAMAEVLPELLPQGQTVELHCQLALALLQMHFIPAGGGAAPEEKEGAVLFPECSAYDAVLWGKALLGVARPMVHQMVTQDNGRLPPESERRATLEVRPSVRLRVIVRTTQRLVAPAPTAWRPMDRRCQSPGLSCNRPTLRMHAFDQTQRGTMLLNKALEYWRQAVTIMGLNEYCPLMKLAEMVKLLGDAAMYGGRPAVDARFR